MQRSKFLIRTHEQRTRRGERTDVRSDQRSKDDSGTTSSCAPPNAKTGTDSGATGGLNTKFSAILKSGRNQISVRFDPESYRPAWAARQCPSAPGGQAPAPYNTQHTQQTEHSERASSSEWKRLCTSSANSRWGRCAMAFIVLFVCGARRPLTSLHHQSAPRSHRFESKSSMSQQALSR